MIPMNSNHHTRVKTLDSCVKNSVLISDNGYLYVIGVQLAKQLHLQEHIRSHCHGGTCTCI